MFKDKIVLITGASQGIGKATALKFAEESASLAINDIEGQEERLKELKNEIEKLGGKANYYLADVANYEEVEKMVQSIKNDFGRLDVLINNAGVCRDKTLAKMTKEDWQKVIDIDLTGVFNCTKAALALIVNNRGKIINVSSLVGVRGNFGQTNYAAAKAGIIGFTKSLAKEVGRFGVTVNAIAPGFIETNLTQKMPEEIKGMVKKFTPLGRFGRPEEVAFLIAFLASEKADYITGSVVSIDGGLSL